MDLSVLLNKTTQTDTHLVLNVEAQTKFILDSMEKPEELREALEESSLEYVANLTRAGEPEGLRDQFAGQVLQGLVAALYSPDHLIWKPEEFAKVCYKYADAMLAERSKK